MSVKGLTSLLAFWALIELNWKFAVDESCVEGRSLVQKHNCKLFELSFSDGCHKGATDAGELILSNQLLEAPVVVLYDVCSCVLQEAMPFEVCAGLANLVTDAAGVLFLLLMNDMFGAFWPTTLNVPF